MCDVSGGGEPSQFAVFLRFFSASDISAGSPGLSVMFYHRYL